MIAGDIMSKNRRDADQNDNIRFDIQILPRSRCAGRLCL